MAKIPMHQQRMQKPAPRLANPPGSAAHSNPLYICTEGFLSLREIRTGSRLDQEGEHDHQAKQQHTQERDALEIVADEGVILTVIYGGVQGGMLAQPLLPKLLLLLPPLLRAPRSVAPLLATAVWGCHVFRFLHQ